MAYSIIRLLRILNLIVLVLSMYNTDGKKSIRKKRKSGNKINKRGDAYILFEVTHMHACNYAYVFVCFFNMVFGRSKEKRSEKHSRGAGIV